jgi:hypothetical protein
MSNLILVRPPLVKVLPRKSDSFSKGEYKGDCGIQLKSFNHGILCSFNPPLVPPFIGKIIFQSAI